MSTTRIQDLLILTQVLSHNALLTELSHNALVTELSHNAPLTELSHGALLTELSHYPIMLYPLSYATIPVVKEHPGSGFRLLLLPAQRTVFEFSWLSSDILSDETLGHF